MAAHLIHGLVATATAASEPGTGPAGEKGPQRTVIDAAPGPLATAMSAMVIDRILIRFTPWRAGTGDFFLTAGWANASPADLSLGIDRAERAWALADSCLHADLGFGQRRAPGAGPASGAARIANDPHLARLAHTDAFGLPPASAGQALVTGLGAPGGSLAMVYERAAAPFATQDLVAIDRLTPAVAEWATAAVDAHFQAGMAATMHGILDRLNCAIIVSDAGGRPRLANRAARDLIERRETLLLATDGTLACRTAARTKALRAAIRTAATTPGDTIGVRLDRFDATPMIASLVALDPPGGNGADRSVLLVAAQSTPAHALAPHVADSIGLLPSETRFLNCFLDTDTLQEAARQSGLSLETARTYLKRIQAKLGVHRQLDLGRMIAAMTPPIAPPPPPG